MSLNFSALLGASAPTTSAVDRLLPSLENARLLLVDDDASVIQVLGKVLSGYTHLRFATSGPQALEIARVWLPELILLDADMPGMDGFEVCRRLKADRALADIPIMFVTQHNDARVEAAVFELGAVDFILKPATGPALRARVAMHLRLQRMGQQLLRLTHRDPLTGVADREQLDFELERECRRALRSQQATALLLTDIDGLSSYNARQGRAAGDHLLRRTAAAIQPLLQRPGDLVARYGPDEFAVLLPDTPATGAWRLAQRIGIDSDSDSDSDNPFEPSDARFARLCIGIGWISPGSDRGDDPAPHETLRTAALAALQASKRPGGARIHTCQATPSDAQSSASRATPQPIPDLSPATS